MSYWLGGVPHTVKEFNDALRLHGAKRHKPNDKGSTRSELYVWAQWPPKYADSAVYYKGRVAPILFVGATQPTEPPGPFRKLGVFLDAAMPVNCSIITVHIQVLGLTPNCTQMMYGTHTIDLPQ